METLSTDVLVIGGGCAGLRAAIAAREAGVNVLLVSKTPVGYANCSAISNAGIAAAMGLRDPNDNTTSHVEDTISGGRSINSRQLVQVLAERAPREISEAERLGLNLRKFEGNLFASITPGHSFPRTVHVEGNGIGMTKPMREFALGVGVRFQEGVLVTQVLKRLDTAVGAFGIEKEGTTFAYKAKAIVLAGGGGGYVYSRTNNPNSMTGDGLALAFRAGASLQDMEFVQCYPTGLHEPGLPAVNVYYEGLVLRGGAVLRNAAGEDILARHGLVEDKQKTRDAMTRALALEIAEGRGIQGAVRMDISAVSDENLQRFKAAFPRALTADPANAPRSFLVSPVVHFFMGGVKINPEAETEVDGLYAAGEVAGGLHGANRLGANALAETLVFGAIAGENAARRALEGDQHEPYTGDVQAETERLKWLARQEGPESLDTLRDTARQAMWQAGGPIRSGGGLQAGLDELANVYLRSRKGEVGGPAALQPAAELENILTVGEMVLRSAMARTESRGAHFRIDHPDEDPDWVKSVLLDRVGIKMRVRVKEIM